MKKALAEGDWLRAGGYLPPFLRDFHAQKDVFKWIWSQVCRRLGGSDHDALGGMTWVQSHIYTIDFFLWFMARHGYTLQRNRRPRFPVADWAATIRDMQNEDAAAFDKMMAERAAAKKEAAG